MAEGGMKSSVELFSDGFRTLINKVQLVAKALVP